eukprot:TRINITY_DN636_c1_g1_i2.p1 TRINITY_DN636_c1_g1~~TRINITY_DN636_c1_g1_i2.p1  ORF type:complete len:865 (+),score=157.86 TRINITY_DN636_c1_g1_i2:225-2597(+)
MVKLKLIGPAIQMAHQRVFVCSSPINSAVVSEMMTHVRLASMGEHYHASRPKLTVLGVRTCNTAAGAERVAQDSSRVQQAILDHVGPQEAAVLRQMQFEVQQQPDALVTAAYTSCFREFARSILTSLSTCTSFIPASAMRTLAETLCSAYQTLLPGDARAPTFAEVWQIVALRKARELALQAIRDREPAMRASVFLLSSARLLEVNKATAIADEFRATSEVFLRLVQDSKLHVPDLALQQTFTMLQNEVDATWRRSHTEALAQGAEPDVFVGHSFNSITGEAKLQLINYVPASGPELVVPIRDQATSEVVAVLPNLVGVNVVLQNRVEESACLISDCHSCEVGAQLTSTTVHADSFNTQIDLTSCNMSQHFKNMAGSGRVGCNRAGMASFLGASLDGIEHAEHVSIHRSSRAVATVSMQSGRAYSLCPQVQQHIANVTAALGVPLREEGTQTPLVAAVLAMLDAVGDVVLVNCDIGTSTTTVTSLRSASSRRNTLTTDSSSSSSQCSGGLLGLSFGRSASQSSHSMRAGDTASSNCEARTASVQEGSCTNPHPILRPGTAHFAPITAFLPVAMRGVVAALIPVWRRKYFFPATVGQLAQLQGPEVIVPGNRATVFVHGDPLKPLQIIVGPDQTALVPLSTPASLRSIKRCTSVELVTVVGENDWDGEVQYAYPTVRIDLVTLGIAAPPGSAWELGKLSFFRKCRKEHGFFWAPNCGALFTLSLVGTPLQLDTARCAFPCGEPHFRTYSFTESDQVVCVKVDKTNGIQEYQTKRGEIITCLPALTVKYKQL